MCYNIIKTRFLLKAYKTESKLQKDGRFIARIILHRSETSSIKIAHFIKVGYQGVITSGRMQLNLLSMAVRWT